MGPDQRLQRVARLSGALAQRGYPRLTMLMVVAGAATTAFLSSVLMLAAGLRYMPVRYAIASLLGYAVFVWLVRRWLAARDRREANQQLVADSIDAVDVLNVADLPGAVARTVSRSGRPAPVDIFQHGRSGGGGATASFSGGPAPMPAVVVPPPAPADAGGGVSWVADLDDDGLKLLPLFAVVAIAVGLFAAGGVVWSAPQLLAEILVDGAVAGQAYRGLRKGNWTGGVLRRTWKPMLAVFTAFVLLGVAGHYFDPTADSIGDFFR